MNKTHDIVAHLEQLAEEVKNGGADAIEALASLRFISKAVSAATTVVDPLAIEQAQTQPKNFFYAGINWTKKEGGVRYKYEGNPMIDDLKEQMSLEEKKAQQAARALQRGIGYHLTDSGFVVRSEDGEVIGYPAIPVNGKDSLTMGK